MATPVLFCVGGAGGIGSACSRLFVQRGWRVCILDLVSSAGVALASELGSSASFHAVDIASEDSIRSAFAAALAFSEGRLDSLVIMSASFLYGEVHTISEAEWAKVCAINVAGPALCIKQAIPVMRAARRGNIVLTSSITAVRGYRRLQRPTHTSPRFSSPMILHRAYLAAPSSP